jgi:biotin carboxylase
VRILRAAAGPRHRRRCRHGSRRARRPALARACSEADITFVGPDADALARLGDKPEARRLAAELGIPVARGSEGPVTPAQARAFLEDLGARS